MKTFVKTGTQSSNDPMEFIMSTESVDRDGDIIIQSGWDLKQFKKNPIALYQHNTHQPIGTWAAVRVEGKKLIGKLKLAKEGTSQVIDEIRSLVEQKILKSVSVGFAAKDVEVRRDKTGVMEGFLIKSAELMECSLVTIPANSEAMVRAKSLGLSPETLDLITGVPAGKFGARSGDTGRKTRAIAGRKANTSTSKLKETLMPKSISEKIVAHKEQLSEAKDAMAAILKNSEDEDRDLTDDEQSEIDAYVDQIEAGEKQLATLERVETTMARKAAVRDDAKRQVIPAVVGKKENPADVLWKMAHVHLRAHREKKSLIDVARERYSSDERVEAILPSFMLDKSASSVAMTNVSNWAQELTDTALSGFIALLEPVSVYGRLAAAGTAIPFGGSNAVTVPRRAALGAVSGSFVGEGNTIPVKQDLYGSVTFNRYKAAVITAFTNEIARVSNPAIEGLLRDAIVLDTGIMLDSVLLDPTMGAVAGIRPASPWNGGATQASAGDDLPSILTDLRFLFDTLSAANAGRNPYLIINPARLSGLSMLTNANGSFVFRDEIANGRLMGVPIIISTNTPADQVYIIDAADFGTAFGSPEFDVSEQATIVMANDDGTDPTMADTNAVSAAGSLHVSDAAGTLSPTVVRSMYQTWSTALRMVMPISWGNLRAGTSAYVTGVSW